MFYQIQESIPASCKYTIYKSNATLTVTYRIVTATDEGASVGILMHTYIWPLRIPQTITVHPVGTGRVSLEAQIQTSPYKYKHKLLVDELSDRTYMIG